MKVFRLSKRKYAQDLSGKGAAKSGNRWNSKGTEMIYTAESRALAMAEVAVHLSLATLPKDYVMIEIEIPDSVKIHSIDPGKLKGDWNSFPPISLTQNIGNKFIRANEYCVLKVPSAVVQGDYNYLINPHHEEVKAIKIEAVYAFHFNQRIGLPI